jgi:hypothetical protein
MRKTWIAAGEEVHAVLLRREHRSSCRFVFLLTDFGALIQGV